MKTTVYGTYKDGQIFFDEPAQTDNARVLVVFLNSLSQSKSETKLADFFDLYGVWEDDRDADTVINDIRQSRTVFFRFICEEKAVDMLYKRCII